MTIAVRNVPMGVEVDYDRLEAIVLLGGLSACCCSNRLVAAENDRRPDNITRKEGSKIDVAPELREPAIEVQCCIQLMPCY